MTFAERALTFPCAGETLVGVLCVPAAPPAKAVLIVVGGPQYRAGSHRQLVLLARDLATAGTASLRFDNRGMGDSDGAQRTFEEIEDDLRVAIDVLCREVPSVRDVVIWGLCGAASAALLYAHRDPRVHGLVLANPWVRTSAGFAQTMVKRYYLPRILDLDVWRRLITGRLNMGRAIADLARTVARSVRPRSAPLAEAFPLRMAEGLARFQGRVLVYLSGEDLTAKEFEEMCKVSAVWKRALAGADVEWRRLPEANHTYSTGRWREQVHGWTIEWLGSW